MVPTLTIECTNHTILLSLAARQGHHVSSHDRGGVASRSRGHAAPENWGNCRRWKGAAGQRDNSRRGTTDLKMQATIDEAQQMLVRANFEMRRSADAFGAVFSKALPINVK